MTRATLNKRIDAFLQTKKKSTGGYAPVDPAEMDALRDIIDGLIKLKYEADPDGDVPVRVHATDLTRFEAPVRVDIAHTHKPQDGLTELELHQRAAEQWTSLALTANKEAQRHTSAVTYLMREALSKHQPLTFGGVRYVAKPPASVTAREVADLLQKTMEQAYRKEPCPVDYSQREAWSKRVADKVSKKLGLVVLARSCTHTVAGVRMYFEAPAFDCAVCVDSSMPKGQAVIIDN